MTIHVFSFEQALTEVRAASKDLEPHQSLELTEKATVYFTGSLQQELWNILHHLIDQQDLSLKHKEDYYNSFEVSVSAYLVQLSFKPKTELVEMLESGAKLGSATDTHLKGNNCKTSKDGLSHYKIIPIRTKDTGIKDPPLEVKRITATRYGDGEENFLKTLVFAISEDQGKVPMEIMYESRDGQSTYYRSAQISNTRKRVYMSTERGKTTKSIDRFTQFRVVSDRPGAKRWREPDIPGRHLAQEAALLYTEHINSVVKKLSRIADAAKGAS